MSANSVAIVGIGMMTSVGLSAAETAASVRARMMRFAETDWLDQNFEPFKLAQVLEEGLPELVDSLQQQQGHQGMTSREVRMLRLATMPLLESVKTIATLKERPGLVLALSEWETTQALDAKSMLEKLALQTNGAFDSESSEIGFKGRSGGLTAIGRAVEKIQSGQVRFMLAGGVDTFCDLYILGTLDQENRVKSSANLDGFIPGEGAGFVLLASPDAARAAGLTATATLTSVSEGFETGHLYSKEPYRGDGLAEVVSKFFGQGNLSEPVREVYSSMNGENHWAKEWGVARLRNSGSFSEAQVMHHPADSFGDTGAACGPLMVGLAAQGLAQRYRQSPCLIYCSSDRGDRSVIGVQSLES